MKLLEIDAEDKGPLLDAMKDTKNLVFNNNIDTYCDTKIIKVSTEAEGTIVKMHDINDLN